MKITNFFSGIRTFFRGLKVLIGITPYARGDKKLAVLSATVRSYIPVAGVRVVRRQIVNSIEKDLNIAVKKNPKVTVDALLSKALNTPDYMDMLKDLDMGEKDLRFFATEALKTRRKNGKK